MVVLLKIMKMDVWSSKHIQELCGCTHKKFANPCHKEFIQVPLPSDKHQSIC